MQVITNGLPEWSMLLSCPDCKSELKIEPTDIKYHRHFELLQGNSIFDIERQEIKYWYVNCGVCSLQLKFKDKVVENEIPRNILLAACNKSRNKDK